MNGSHISVDRMRNAMRRNLSMVTARLGDVFNRRSLPRIRTRPARMCILCLDTVDQQDSYRCMCGADYHSGCFMTLRVCSRCGHDSSEEKTALRESGWLPKFAEFRNLPEDESFTSLHCLNCKAEVGSKDRYCTGCGYHLGTLTNFLCPVCSTEIEAGNAFCSCCGATFGNESLTLVQCPYCRRLLKAGELECRCGMRLPPTCTKCGSPIGSELYCPDCDIWFEPEHG